MPNEKVIKERPVDARFKDWGKLGRWEIAGFKIVETEEGPRVDQLKKRRYMVVDRPWDVIYSHSYGRISPFFEALLGKKLMGTRCPKCGDTFCPPRAHCWRNECRLAETEWVEMPMKGTLHSYGIMGFSGEAFLDGLPFILAFVRPDGSNTMLSLRLMGIDPWDVECDMRVTIKFIDKPTGNMMDLYCVPDGMPKNPKSDKEKARIREKLQPVYEWVAQRKAAAAKAAAAKAPKAALKARAKPKAKPRPKARPKPRAKPKAKPKTRPKSKPKAKAKPKKRALRARRAPKRKAAAKRAGKAKGRKGRGRKR